MAEPLPNDKRCGKCGEWFHNAHVCPVTPAMTGSVSMEPVALPDWLDVSQKADDGVELSPLEAFVYENEPADGLQWRVMLTEALQAAEQKGRREALEEIADTVRMIRIKQKHRETVQAVMDCEDAIRALIDGGAK